MYKRKILYYVMSVFILMVFSSCGTKEVTESESKEIHADTEKPSDEPVLKEKNEFLAKTPELKTASPESIVESQIPAETEEPDVQEPQITELNVTMYATEDVNVRSGDNKDASLVGSLTIGQEVLVSGQSSSSGWYRIDYNGHIGFVSNKYLQSEKPITQPEQSEEEIVHKYSSVCQAIVDFYNNLSETDGNYVIFEGSDTHEEAGYYTAIVRYQLTDKEAQDKIESGGTPSANTYVTTVTVDMATGVAEDECGNIWNIY